MQVAKSSRDFHPGLILALIGIPIFIGALDLTVISAVLPQVIQDLEIPLNSGLDKAAWMVTGYLLAYAVSMTFMGQLSDLYGRRRVYLTALGIFAFGSYLVAIAPTWPLQIVLRIYYMVASGRPDVAYATLYVLIAARMVQAFGAGAMVPVGMALVGDMFPKGSRAAPLGLIAAVDTAGWVVGHLYGGILVRFWPWATIFWLNLPICTVAFLTIWFFLRKLPQELKTGRMDWLGVGLVAGFLTLLNLGLGQGSEGGVGNDLARQSAVSQISWQLLLLSVVFFLAFLWRQGHARYPLLDMALFRKPNYFLACVLNLLIGGCLFIAIANVPLFINSFVNNTPQDNAWLSGWMLCALTVPMALISVPGGWLCEKYGYRFPTVIGLVGAVSGFMLMQGWTAATSTSSMVFPLILSGIGLGLTMAPIATAVLDATPLARLGASSALVIIFRLIGMMVGVSSITTYGLTRADVLSKQMLPQSPSAMETYQVGIKAMEMVISETFIIAAGVALVAMLGAMFLKNQKQSLNLEESNERE
jgi:MFS family permease